MGAAHGCFFIEGEHLKAERLEKYFEDGRRCRGAGYLRFILMAFVCFRNYGFPEPTGLLSELSGFAAPCFYILSGFFVLPDDREMSTGKTKRKIRRTVLCLAFMFILYLLVNIAVCVIQKIEVPLSPRVVFNFLVLNLWPLPAGSNIMFIHSMLYAYIVIYIAQRLRLMRYYKAVLVFTFVFMLLTGEFAGVIHFDVLGYHFISANWLTRALPYILLGKFIREHGERMLSIRTWQYILLVAAGAVLTAGEMILLDRAGLLIYQGHMAGYGLMAFAACGLALSRPTGSHTRITRYDTVLSGLICMFMDPVYCLLGILLESRAGVFFVYCGGIAALLISAVLAYLCRKNRLFNALYTRSKTV